MDKSENSDHIHLIISTKKLLIDNQQKNFDISIFDQIFN